MGLDSASADLAKTYGEENRCPACGAFARIDKDPEFRFVCAVCGAPRIGGKSKPSDEVNAAIVTASKAKRNAFAWRAGSWALGVPAALTLILAAVLAPQSLIAAGVLIAGGIALAIASARASRTAATEKKKLYAAWTEAWESATLAFLDERGDQETTAADVAKALELPAPDAEVLLNMLSARSSVRVRVDEDQAKLVYEPEIKSNTTSPLATTVGVSTTAPDTTKDAARAEAELKQAQAEAEAAAEEEAAAEKAKT